MSNIWQINLESISNKIVDIFQKSINIYSMDQKTKALFLQDLTASLSNLDADGLKKSHETYDKFVTSYNSKNKTNQIPKERIDVKAIPNMIQSLEQEYGVEIDFITQFESILSALQSDSSSSDPVATEQLQLIVSKYDEIKMKYQHWRDDQDINNF